MCEFKEGDIVRFNDMSQYRGAIGIVKGVQTGSDCDECIVLMEGDDDSWDNYYLEYDYEIRRVYPDEMESDDGALSDKPAFQVGDVVSTPCGIQAVREIVIVNTEKTAKYAYEVSPLDAEDTIFSYGEDSLEFQYHDSTWKEYFTRAAQNNLPEWRGELYNLEMFRYGREGYMSERDYFNDTLPPGIMEYILEEYAIARRIDAVLAPRKNQREIEKKFNLRPKELHDVRRSILDKIYNRNMSEVDRNFKKEVSDRRKFAFTDLELSVASEIDKRDIFLGKFRNHFPVHMTNTEIMKSVREAYHTAHKISERRIRKSYVMKYVLYNEMEPVRGSALYEGVSGDGLAIRFWYNFDLGIIETAYPVSSTAS